jgi:uncharacterized integral membrane protein
VKLRRADPISAVARITRQLCSLPCPPASARGEVWALSRQLRTILITVIATIVLIMALQNMRGVLLRLIVWDATVPLALLLLAAFGAGVAVAAFWRRR